MPDVAGVVYFAIASAPGHYFDCQDYRATLSQESCARNHLTALAHPVGEHHMDVCRACKTGAVHAGRAEPPKSSASLTYLCCRCHEFATRLVRGAICVSCYNREREVLAQRNAKGTAPKALNVFWMRGRPTYRREGVVVGHKTVSVHAIHVQALIDGRLVVGMPVTAADLLEARLSLVRRDPNAVLMFCAPRRPHAR